MKDIGLQCLTIVAKTLLVPIDLADIKKLLGLGGPAGSLDIVRAAKASNLEAVHLDGKTLADLYKLPLPAILPMNDGGFLVLVSVLPNEMLMVRDPLDSNSRPTPVSELDDWWSGEVILITKQDVSHEEAAPFDLRWFLQSAARYKNVVFQILICSFFLQLFSLVTPLFFQAIVDKVLVHDSEATLEVIIAALVIAAIFEAILSYLRSYGLVHTSNRIDLDLGSQAFSRLFRLPVSYFESRSTGQTVARMRELESIRAFLTGQAITSLLDAVFTLVFLAVLFYYSVSLTLIVLTAMPAYLAVILLIRPRLRDRLREQFNRGAYSQQFLVESIVGALTLKAAAVEPTLQRQWESRLAAYLKASFDSSMLGAKGQSIIQAISRLTTAAIILFGARAVINNQLSVGQLVAFNMIANQLTNPILRLSRLWQDLQQVQVSVDRIGDIFRAEPEGNTEAKLIAPQTRIRGDVVLQNLQFRYQNDGPVVLSDFSLRVPSGQVIGIVGHSGSGKSTLTKIIQRLYVPEKGRVLIDDVDIAHVPPQWFRRQMGVVLQENILFNRTVHENIAIASPNMSRDQVIAVARLSGAHDFIQHMPRGYETIIEERGANLSGGQRQRIAIARALAVNPRILIFDEATSALDYESERAIQENMDRIVAGRTVFIVAHRLAAVRQCDRIVVMQEGRIVEEGSHEELLLLEAGYYRKLYAIQSPDAVASKGM